MRGFASIHWVCFLYRKLVSMTTKCEAEIKGKFGQAPLTLTGLSAKERVQRTMEIAAGRKVAKGKVWLGAERDGEDTQKIQVSGSQKSGLLPHSSTSHFAFSGQQWL